MTTTPRSRRELTVAVLACLAGAGLSFAASNQDWAVRVTHRQPPLSPLRETFSGADLAPWLPAVALVGLAAAVALLATRRWGRVAVAVVAMICGVAIVAAGIVGVVADGAAGRTAADAGLWPLTCWLGGLVVFGSGVLAVRRGRTWPAMGARYQRPDTAVERVSETSDDVSTLWDALDSGADPTAAADETSNPGHISSPAELKPYPRER